jgi:hypothetical protein
MQKSSFRWAAHATYVRSNEMVRAREVEVDRLPMERSRTLQLKNAKSERVSLPRNPAKTGFDLGGRR